MAHLIFSFAAACPPLPSPFATNEEGSEGIERRGARAGSRRYLLLRGALLLVAVGVLLRRRGRRRRRRGAAGEQERPAAANAADDGASDKARLRLAAPQKDAAAGREHVLRRASHLPLSSFLPKHSSGEVACAVHLSYENVVSHVPRSKTHGEVLLRRVSDPGHTEKPRLRRVLDSRHTAKLISIISCPLV